MQAAATLVAGGGSGVRERIAELFDDGADFLAHAALVSKILWPPRSDNHPAGVRGRTLRESLGVTPGHALEGRDLRNHLEHYDERLDSWAAATTGTIVDGIVGPRSGIAGVPDSDIMRLYDPQTRTFFFRGELFDLQAIAGGLDNVANRAAERLQAIAPDLFASLRSSRLI